MKSFTIKSIQATLIFVGLCVFLSIPASFAKSQERIVHFPKERSAGLLYIPDANRVDKYGNIEWEFLCEAKGDVKVPAGKELKLEWSKEAGSDLSALSKLGHDDLDILYISGVEIEDDQLRHISHLTGLQELGLWYTRILGTGLKYLANLKSLKILYLPGTEVGDNELAYLSDLPSLENLNLAGTPTNDPGMIHIGKIKSLKVLVLSRGVGDEGLSHLGDLTSLRSLTVQNPAVSDEGIAHLAGMTQMEDLVIYGTQISDEGLACLKHMKKLKELKLSRTRITEKGLVHLEGLDNLEYLGLPFIPSDAGLMQMSNLPKLKSIEINENSITTKGIAALQNMKSLEGISINCKRKNGSYQTDAVVKEVAKSLRLKSLTIGNGLSDEGLISLKDMPSLKRLEITNLKITNKGIAALAELPSLRELSFIDAEFSLEDEWASFGKLTSLDDLFLFGVYANVTDECIANLDNLNSLKTLSIIPMVLIDDELVESMEVTDKGLEHISKLHKLEILSLRGAKITDEGLKYLEDLGSLKSLDLAGSNVTEDGMQQLKKKLPTLNWFL